MFYLDNAKNFPYVGVCSLLKITPDDCGTTLVVFGDCSGQIEIVVPEDKVSDINPLSIPATGVPVVLYGGCESGVPTCIGLYTTDSNSISTIPPLFVPETHKRHHKKLMTLLQENVTDERCHCLLYDVLTDDFIAPQFQTIGASNECHHSEEGGLLRHTLEVVEEVLASPILGQWDEPTKSLAVTVAVLHDIGKCHHRFGAFRFWAVGHEDRALELIANPLRRLDESWPDGAEMIRLCLIRKPLCNGESPIRVLVKNADRMSATNDAYTECFKGIEYWKASAKAQGSNHRTYYRPK